MPPVSGVFLASLVAALVLTPLCRRLAVKTGFLAIPTARGVHREPTPLLGGVAIFFGFAAGAIVATMTGVISITTPWIGFLGGGLAIFAMGIIDDRVNLSWSSKLLGQIVAAVFLFASDNERGTLFFAPIELVVSMVWIVGITNAMNFLDNMDGIAAGIAAIASAFFFALATISGEPEVAVFAAAVCGASLGFLRFNFPPARIFLGDGGSLFLGYALASQAFLLGKFRSPGVEILIPALVLAYPIFDITFVTLTRATRGQNLTQAGKDHTSHRLGRILSGARPTAFVIYGICAVAGVVALGLDVISFPPAIVVGFAAITFGFIAFGSSLCRRAPVPDPAPAETAVP